ncbi:hypothetical protein BC941DRAFT_356691 [Chlamydoabsidia padenii]|nr:hypothetical protein BC941DRAFT_356691 [Chlamydoabsidia padenii]
MERSKRKRRAPLNFSLLNNPRRTKSLCHTTPRWYNQHYIIFLALREHPDHCLSRPALIDAALALDAKISKERNLPRVFRSKTPGNSASAVLTINRDKCYIPYKPEGSRSTWFKLAYTPGNFDQAYEEYKKWMTKLTEHDWPYCFGIPLPGVTTTTTAETNQDSLLNPLGTQSTEEATTTTTTQSTEEGTTTCQGVHSTDDKETTTDHDTDDKENVQIPAPSTTSNKKKKHQRKNKGKSPSTLDKPSSSTTLTTQLSIPQPVYQLGQLDLSDIPTRWQDIIRIDTSTIPNAGQGLFALRDLPYNTPLGFYFGVPMTEYEFDSMKEKVGRASEYSICYRRTVLDATNEKGEPYTLPDNDDEPLCPFHYMNEAKEESLANILFVEGVVVNQVICWSKRLILPGEELFVWYGKDVNRYWDNDNNNNKKQRNS